MNTLCFLLASALPIANPILSGFYPDPSACKVNGKYCLANSSMQYFPAVPLFESEDLVHWQLKGYVVDRPGVAPLGGVMEFAGFFAPTIRFHEGRFYIVASNTAADEKGVVPGAVITTATKLEGPWSAPHPIIGAPPCGDPSLDFIDGVCYFTCTTGTGILMAKADPVAGKLLEPTRQIWTSAGGTYPEAPHVFRRGDWYYLMIAEGGTEYGHSQTIARSRSVYGPYEGCPRNPIAGHHRLKAQSSKLQAVGHGDFVYDEKGNGWFICHAIRPQWGKTHLAGRETIIAPMRWAEDGWPLINEGEPIPLDAAKAVRQPRQWVWIRNPILSNYRVDDEKGTVELKPTSVKLTDVATPTFIGTRQIDPDQDFTATLAQAPSAGVETGLVSYMGRTHFYALTLSVREGRCVAFVRYQLGTMSFESKAVPVEKFPCELQIETRAKNIRFLAGGALVAEADPRHISSEVNTDNPYSGVMLGCFAESSLSDPEWIRFSF